LHPLCALRRFFQFPEGRLGLEPVDEEGARLECGLAVRRGSGHEHDALPGLEPAIAMYDEAGREGPAPRCFGLDLLQLLLGHARIVLERHGADRPVMDYRAARNVRYADQVAHQPDEARHAADIVSPGRKPLELRAHVEVLALYLDHGGYPT